MPAASFMNEQNTKIILEAFRNGASINLAAAAAGISHNTVRKWIRDGADAINNETENEYSDFYRKYRQALWECANGWLGNIRTAAPTDWRAAAWMLERRFPNDYGKDTMDSNASVEDSIADQTREIEIVEVVKDHTNIDEFFNEIEAEYDQQEKEEREQAQRAASEEDNPAEA